MLMGQQLGSYTPSTHGNHWDTTLAAARACEQAGLDSVWLADHLMFPDKADPEKEVPVFDCFVALGAIAALGELRWCGRRGFRSQISVNEQTDISNTHRAYSRPGHGHTGSGRHL
jgi:hypothetical protein